MVQLLHHADQPSILAHFHDQMVELFVVVQIGRRQAVVGFIEFSFEAKQPCPVVMSVDILGGQARRYTLQGLANLIDVLCVGRGQAPNASAFLMLNLYQPFGFQSSHRVTDRRSAGTKSGPDFAFDQALTRRDASGLDLAPDRLDDLFNHRD